MKSGVTVKNENEEPIDNKDKNIEIIGIINLTDLIKNLVLIKKYNFENSNNESIYLCADYIEKELLKLRYSNNFKLDKSWY